MSASPKTQSEAPALMLVESLSERELQVLCLLDSPLTSTEIGRELYVSVNTIRTHIRNIYSKLDAHGRIEAIQKVKELGLIRAGSSKDVPALKPLQWLIFISHLAYA